MGIKYSDCVLVALFIQHAMRMSLIILLSVASSPLPYFFTLSLKWHDFRKKQKLLRIKCVFNFLYKVFLINFSL